MANPEGERQRLGEDFAQARVVLGLADDVAENPTQKGPYPAQRPVGALELFGVGVALIGDQGVLADPSRISAYLQGESIGTVSEADFAGIVRAGLAETLAAENAIRLELDPAHADAETLDLVQAPPEEQARRIEQILINRTIRDASFRRQVCDAYENKCAVTGLQMVNGGGKAEVQAAHIWSAAAGGPDVVRNGLALSGAVHWLFDRHLISLTDDYRLLVSHNKGAERASYAVREANGPHPSSSTSHAMASPSLPRAGV